MKEIRTKNVILALLFLLSCVVIIVSGCSKVSKSEISYSPVVCQYSTSPNWGMTIEFFSFNIKVMDNNTVEVYCGDYEGRANGEEFTVDYIYGETFEITEEQKQEIIDIIKKNKISWLGDCSSLSTDGSDSYIMLFDENGEVIHTCGGLNPERKRFVKTKDALFDLLPEGTYSDIREKAKTVLIEDLAEKYPDDYGHWLED